MVVPDAGPELSFPVCAGSCLPDDPLACADFDPDDELEVRGLYRDSETRLVSFRELMSTGVDAGLTSPRPAPGSAAGGGTAEGGAAGTPSEPGAPVAQPEMETSWSCQIDRDEGEVSVGCWLAGTGGDGDPCTSTRACQAGFACVDEGETGRCRKFCCGGDDSCSELNLADPLRNPYYCDERPLRSANIDATRNLAVPVCAQAETCDLSDRRCEAPGCKCDQGEICTIVSQDGAAGCVTPGEGALDEPCPCQVDYVCHPVEKVCKRLCDLGRTDECGEGICQAAANYPAPYGLCQPVAPETN